MAEQFVQLYIYFSVSCCFIGTCNGSRLPEGIEGRSDAISAWRLQFTWRKNIFPIWEQFSTIRVSSIRFRRGNRTRTVVTYIVTTFNLETQFSYPFWINRIVSCFTAAIIFSARTSARWLFTTKRACTAPGIQKHMVRIRLSTAWKGLPHRSTASGGRTMARRYLMAGDQFLSKSSGGMAWESSSARSRPIIEARNLLPFPIQR